MALRHHGESPKKAIPGQLLLVIRKYCTAFCAYGDVGRRVENYTGPVGLRTKTFADYTSDPDDFEARSPDELSLVKGDKIELVERDDDFGDGWYLGKHVKDDRTGLFPEG